MHSSKNDSGTKPWNCKAVANSWVTSIWLQNAWRACSGSPLSGSSQKIGYTPHLDERVSGLTQKIDPKIQAAVVLQPHEIAQNMAVLADVQVIPPDADLLLPTQLRQHHKASQLGTWKWTV